MFQRGRAETGFRTIPKVDYQELCSARGAQRSAGGSVWDEESIAGSSEGASGSQSCKDVIGEKGECKDEFLSEAERKLQDNRAAVQSMAQTHLGIKSLHFPMTSLNGLKEETVSKYARQYRRVMKSFFKIVSLSESKEWAAISQNTEEQQFWMKGSEGTRLANVVSSVASSFVHARTAKQRVQTLSAVAPYVNLKEIQNYIPGLSQQMYAKARLFAKQYMGMEVPPDQKVKIERTDKAKLGLLLGFITSDLVITDLPFGWSKKKLGAGDSGDIPVVVHHLANEHVWQMYNRWLSEIGQADMRLSRMTVLRILKACTATKRHSVHGLDSFSFDGLEGFDDLKGVIKQLAKKKTTEANWKEKQLKKLREAKVYLRGDYKVHVSSASEIPDHCSRWALSDEKDVKWSEGCIHQHALKCQRCEMLKDLLKDVKLSMDNVATNETNIKERMQMEFAYESASNRILAWKAHQLRTVHQENAKVEIWELASENDVYIFLDFAMKWPQSAGRESQAGWYGKRGTVWHEGAAFNKKIGFTYRRIFTHVLDESTAQNTQTVQGILVDILKRIKKE